MAGLLDFLQAASNAAASNVSGPIDLLSWALKKGGVPVGDAPMLGSEWMKRQGLMRDADLTHTEHSTMSMYHCYLRLRSLLLVPAGCDYNQASAGQIRLQL